MNKIILLVNGNEDQRNILGKILKEEIPGVEIVPAKNGVEALELFRKNYSRGIEMIIASNDLLILSGTALVGLIKGTHGSVPIILTGDGLEPKGHKANAFVPTSAPSQIVEVAKFLLSHQAVQI